MAEREPSFFDYVRSAFFARKRMKGLGGVPLNLLVLLGFGVAGLADPGLLLIGAGYEVAYLAWLSQNERFRNLVRGQRLRAEATSFAERLAAVRAALTPEGRARLEALERKCEAIRKTTATLGLPVASLAQMSESGLSSLLTIHARLLVTRELLQGYLRESELRALDEKLAAANDRLGKATSEAMRRSLESNVEILKKRIQYHQAARENLQVIEAEIERIENQVDLIREELALSRDPAALSARIDAIASTIGEANRFLQTNEALIGDLGLPGGVAALAIETPAAAPAAPPQAPAREAEPAREAAPPPAPPRRRERA